MVLGEKLWRVNWRQMERKHQREAQTNDLEQKNLLQMNISHIIAEEYKMVMRLQMSKDNIELCIWLRLH